MLLLNTIINDIIDNNIKEFELYLEMSFCWDIICKLSYRLGEAVVITPVLATVGRPAILTTYFTARDLSDVRITWQKRSK